MDSMTYLLMLVILTALIAIIPQIAKRFHVSSVVAIMLAGIAIGPHSINLLQKLNHFMGRRFPTERLYSVVDVFGLLGLVFLMSLAGLEADLRIIRRERRAVAWLSTLTFFIPAIAGFFVYWISEPDHLVGQLLSHDHPLHRASGLDHADDRPPGLRPSRGQRRQPADLLPARHPVHGVRGRTARRERRRRRLRPWRPPRSPCSFT